MSYTRYCVDVRTDRTDMLRDQLNRPGNRGGILMGAAACLLTVGIGASLGVSGATAEDRPDGPAPESVIAALDAPADAFPAAIDTDELIKGGMDRSTLQKLGSDGAKSFWTGVDNAGDICLITILDVRLTTAASCSTPANVEENGLDLTAAGDNHQPDYDPVVVILLPDSAMADPVAEESYASDSQTFVESVAEEAQRQQSSKQRSYDKKAAPQKNPWKKHGSNLVVAKRSEVPKDVRYDFGRKRGERGPKISYHG